MAIQQPEHAPWVGFFNKIMQCDLFLLLDNVQFKRRYYENRNKVKTKDGTLWVMVPVESKSKRKQKINEVRIQENLRWKNKYIGTLEFAYRKSPFWGDVEALIVPVLLKKHINLLSLNEEIILKVCNYLGVATHIELASRYKKNNHTGSELILELCKATTASTYISGPDGKNYLDSTKFEQANINIVYHHFIHPAYSQLNGEFVSHQSVIDLIANHGPASASIIRECYNINFQ